ncbi:MAG: hypothetical protein ACRYGP_00615 [Janthinobacterium lividum]
MPTGPQRIVALLRTAAASHTTAIAAFVVMTALHLRWLHRSAHAGDVLSAYGAGVVILGVMVGSRPYLRAGVARLIERDMPEEGAGVFGGPVYDAEVARLRREALPGVTLDVWAERVITVAVVVVGTLLKGWGTPLARRWDWPV